MPRSKNSSGVYRPKLKKLRTSRLSRSANVPDPGRVRNGYGWQGAFEPPPEDGAQTKRSDREIPVPISHTDAETKKTSELMPPKKNDHIYIFMYAYAWWLYKVGEGGGAHGMFHIERRRDSSRCRAFGTNCGRMAFFRPTRVVC